MPGKSPGAEFGLPFDRAQLNEYGGIPTRKIVTMLAEQHGMTVDVEAFARRKVALPGTDRRRPGVFPPCGSWSGSTTARSPWA